MQILISEKSLEKNSKTMQKTTCFSDDGSSSSGGGGYVIYELLTKQVWNGKKREVAAAQRGRTRITPATYFFKAFAFTTTVTKEHESGYYFSPFK